MDPADILCEEHFRATHQRDPTGRFVVRLPFLSDATPLQSNQEVTTKRLKSLERRLDNDQALLKAYQDSIQEYINLGHISIISPRASYLLPHHAVFKQSSSTTKCRIVFDCSSPDVSGLSLNDRLYRGPPLLNDISLLLIKFRLFKICLMADIKMMYRMVSVHPEDRRNLVIAWRGNQYQMNRLPFGLKPAGYIGGRCIMKLDGLHEDEFPAAAKAIRENRYADDFCTGADTLEGAKELQYQLTQLLSRGGFEIRRWSSNVPDQLPEVKNDIILNIQEAEPVDAIIRRFSSLSRMQRVLARIVCLAHNFKHQKNGKISGPLSSTELKNSLYLAIGLSQRESFGSEIDRIKKGKPIRKELQKLSPFFDEATGLRTCLLSHRRG